MGMGARRAARFRTAGREVVMKRQKKSGGRAEDISPAYAAIKRWRIKNREHYLAKQREYQRAYRERQKAKADA